MNRIAATLCPAAIALCLSCAAAAPTAVLGVGGRHAEAEVVSTRENMEKGLMNRESLKPDHGMLFVFESPRTVCMWMKNTLVPLSVAFIGEDGGIISVHDMEPLTETLHCSESEALFALEMERGWFGKAGAARGDPVSGLPRRAASKER